MTSKRWTMTAALALALAAGGTGLARQAQPAPIPAAEGAAAPKVQFDPAAAVARQVRAGARALYRSSWSSLTGLSFVRAG